MTTNHCKYYFYGPDSGSDYYKLGPSFDWVGPAPDCDPPDCDYYGLGSYFDWDNHSESDSDDDDPSQ